ncbi:MAG TPA: glutaredoxin 3 [Rhodanobacteraceae bacterium]|jgi:glutaredoxin 3
MADIEIYSTAICPYCIAAKNLLKAKGVGWREIRIDTDPAARAAMLERSGGRRTVPQIFIDGAHVGGFDELAQAEHDGTLARLLDGDAARQ